MCLCKTSSNMTFKIIVGERLSGVVWREWLITTFNLIIRVILFLNVFIPTIFVDSLYELCQIHKVIPTTFLISIWLFLFSWICALIYLERIFLCQVYSFLRLLCSCIIRKHTHVHQLKRTSHNNNLRARSMFAKMTATLLVFNSRARSRIEWWIFLKEKARLKCVLLFS